MKTKLWFAVLTIGMFLSTFIQGQPLVPSTSKDAALERVLQYAAGHQEFKNLYFKEHEQDFLRLVREGQTPQVLFIGCSDSRVVPNLILSANPGDLFVIRTAGNFVPPPDPFIAWDGVAASLQYAVEVIGVKDIIVCGHSQCGAIKGLFQQLDDQKLGLVNKWLQIGEKAKQITLLSTKGQSISQEELYRLAEKISVVFQLDHLMCFPFVKTRVENNTLFLHGWYFDIEKGEISYFDPQKEQYFPLIQTK